MTRGDARQTVNDECVGPTLRLRHGDRLEIETDNKLAETTNLHTHGFFVSPAGNSDNVFVSINAGQTFENQYAINNGVNPGTYGYHAHLHASHRCSEGCRGSSSSTACRISSTQMVVKGDPVKKVAMPTTMMPLDDLGKDPIAMRRSFVFSENTDTNQFHINGKHFDPNRNGQPYDARSWQDAVILPVGGTVVMRMRFRTFTGMYVFHCHILSHEDNGMMGVVNVS
jgi:FtsP/CotA-like multicopper oxidase with cupredoxin domain